MNDDIVTRLRILPKWQRDIVEGNCQMLSPEQLRRNDYYWTKKLLFLWRTGLRDD